MRSRCHSVGWRVTYRNVLVKIRCGYSDPVGGGGLDRLGEGNRRMRKILPEWRSSRYAGINFWRLKTACNSGTWWLKDSEQGINHQKFRLCRIECALPSCWATECNHDTEAQSWEVTYELTVVYGKCFKKIRCYFIILRYCWRKNLPNLGGASHYMSQLH